MRSPDGKRRCDAVCHLAKGPKCTCLCGGKYHGAVVLTTKVAERQELEELILAKTTHIVVPSDAPTENQPSIFGDENVS